MNSLDAGKTATAAAAAQPVAVDDALMQAPLHAATSRPTFLDEAVKEPWRFDFFMMMRRLERTFRDRPRIGDSRSLREDFVLLGQDPFMDFPASNLSRVEPANSGQIRVHAKFLGLLGPQGALPLSTTEEAYGWALNRDEAFPRFLDVFNHRFLQLFFRAWADARPIVQHDRPDADRFLVYVGAMIGLGSLAYRNLDSVPDLAKLAFAGLMAPQAKSASRLSALIGGLFGSASRSSSSPARGSPSRRASAAGSAPATVRWAATSWSARPYSACRTRFASASTPPAWRSTCASCRPATAASRSSMRCSSTSAISSTGKWNWRCHRATSSR